MTQPHHSAQRYTFGPVPSRRLGRSLGVDLVPLKTCSYDCLYCQLGRTTCKTAERRPWVPTDAVLEELDHVLPPRGAASGLDYVTFSGSGEPTLHSDAGRIIEFIKHRTDVPVAVLTNGSLLWRDEVRAELDDADLVVPSLDAGNAPMFRAMNRPTDEIGFDRMMGGLEAFTRDFDGQVWLEVFLLDGYNADDDEVRAIADAARRVAPDRVQLNTACRPAAEPFARAVPAETLEELSCRFQPPAEVIAARLEAPGPPRFDAGCEEILNMLRRRPCSVADIAAASRRHRNEVVKYLQQLQAEGRVTASRSGTVTYYAARG
ncbi:MAG: radical SAM protein [Planctomycetota bacterium]